MSWYTDMQNQGLQYLSAPAYDEDWINSQMLQRGLRQYWDENTGQMRYASQDDHLGLNPIDLLSEYTGSTARLKDADTRYGTLLSKVPYTDREHYWPQLTIWLAQNAPGKVGQWFTDTYNKAASGKPRNTNGEPAQIAKLYANGTPEERAFMEQYGLNAPEVQQTLVGKMGKAGLMFTKNKDPLGLKIMQAVTTGLITGGIGAALAPAVGAAASGLGANISGQAASGIAGAGVGGLTSGLTGGNPLLGALAGGIGGYYNPEVSGLFGGDSSNVLGGGGGIDNLGFAGTSAAGSPTVPSALETFGYGNLFDTSLAGAIPTLGGADVMAGATGAGGLFDLAGNVFSPSNLGQLAVQGGSTFGEAGGGSWLDDAAGTAKSFLGSAAGKVASSLAGGLLNYMGVKEATSAQQKAAEELADLMLKNGQITPSTVNTPWGSASVYTDANGNIIANASAPQGDLARYISGLEQGLGTFNPEEYASNYINTLRNYARPEEDRLRESLESRLLNRGMMGTESGARLFGKQEEAFSQTDLQRQLAGDKQGRGIYESYLNNLYQMGQYPSGLINPAISLGLKNANNLTGGLGAAAEPLWYSGMNSGLAWGNLLQSLGDQVSSLGTSSSGSSSTPNYTFNVGGTDGLFSGTGYNGKGLGYWGQF